MPIEITITIPDQAAPDVMAAMSERVKLPPTGPNAKIGLIDLMKRETISWRARQAAATAAVAAQTQSESDLTGVT